MSAMTPGPWSIVGWSGDEACITATNPDTGKKMHVTLTMMRGDARPVAAVPEMIDALSEARTQVAILQERLGIQDNGSGTLSIIDAALAKAGVAA
jgi:hypothetical protein